MKQNLTEEIKKFKLLSKYSTKNTLTENIVTISEQPDDKFDTPYNKEFMRKNYQKPLTFDEFMEKFREGVYSIGGITLETFLTSLGLPEPVVGSYITLLVYDIYKWLTSGSADWLNIIFDLLGVVTSGLFVGQISQFVKTGKKFTKITEALEYLKTTTIWKTISPYLKKIGSFITSISSKVDKVLKWIGEKIKNSTLIEIINFEYKELMSFGGKIISSITSIWKSISEWIERGVTKVVSKSGVSTKTAQAAGQAAKVGAQQSAVLGAGHVAVKAYQKQNDAQYTQDVQAITQSNPEAFDY